MAEFNPARTLATLAEHSVNYVLIGGVAAALHGSNLVTTDLDVTPERSDENLVRLSSALRTLHAKIRTEATPEGLPFSHDGASLANSLDWNLVTDHGDLDIAFMPDGTEGFADLEREAIVIEVFGTLTSVAALSDIIRSKQAANRAKDIAALPTLQRLLDESS